jgi:hypothetical protein
VVEQERQIMTFSDFIFGNKIYSIIDSGNISIRSAGASKKYEGPADVALIDGKIELGAIVDVFKSVGARKVFVWKGVELTDQDILSPYFYKTGKEGGEFIYHPGKKYTYLGD